MEISYQPLSHNTWIDGLEFYEDISAWAKRYEQTDMVPADSNRKICDELVPLLLHWTPRTLQPFARQIVGTMMGAHLRAAMIL